MLNLTEKHCNFCGENKKRTEFSKQKSAKDGLCHRCRSCKAVLRKKYRDRDREYCKMWNRKNKERRKEITFKKDLWKNFKITPEEYNTMLQKQDFGCAICKQKKSKSGRRLAVDHCHKSNEIRGLLCNECNTGLGLFQDDVIKLEAAIVYIRSRSRG